MFNLVVLTGRLTADAELKYTQNNIPVTAFNLAVERRYQKDGERQADFINCVAWRNTAEFISKYFAKGDPITIQGELQTRKYTDKNGNNRVAVEVIVNDARFVPQKSSGDNSGNNPPRTFSNNNEYDDRDIDDDLPF